MQAEPQAHAKLFLKTQNWTVVDQLVGKIRMVAAAVIIVRQELECRLGSKGSEEDRNLWSK